MPIKIQVASSDPLSTAVDVLVLGVPEGSPSGEGVLAKLQESLGEAVPKQLKRDDFSGKKDQSVEFTTYERVKPARVLVVGLGKGPHSDVDVRLLAAKGARFAPALRRRR